VVFSFVDVAGASDTQKEGAVLLGMRPMSGDAVLVARMEIQYAQYTREGVWLFTRPDG